MGEFLFNFMLCFVPIFIAIDAPSLLPIFIAITKDHTEAERRKVILHSFLTAVCVGVAFMFAGKGLLRAMGITASDFQIAGGIILLGLAITEILGHPIMGKDSAGTSVGVVPLGIPLMVGPGVLTASMLLTDLHGYVPTILALVLNLVITVVGFLLARHIIRLLGNSGTRALAKFVGLLLAAYAVMLIRSGIIKAIAASA